MPHIFVPSGRLSTKRRDFPSVVADIRHAVFSVVRFRPSQQNPGLFDIFALGSGFFVSSEVFITCWHVIDQPANLHQAGDTYRLVANLPGGVPIALPIVGDVGTDIHLFPDKDLAVLICKARKDQPFVPISYADIPVGSEIGVAGYPLARLTTDPQGNPNVSALVYRVAKGVATAVFRDSMDTGDGHPLVDVPIVEVNFLFVPGNSGGPIFDAETGRAIAYVKGFRAPKIQEKVEQCFPQTQVPAGLSNTYMSCVNAVYSIGLTLDRVRGELEQFGVKL
jgi:S1-C subfamily serine protease